MNHNEPTRVGNENMTSAPSGAFKTQDGLINIAANQDRQWEQLVIVLEAPELNDNPLYQSRELRKENRYTLKSDIEEILMNRSTTEWLDRLSAANIPAGSVLSVKESLELQQVREREFTLALDQTHPAERIDVVTNGFLLNQKRLKPASRVEKLGESTDSILQELGYDSNRIQELKNEGSIR
jgi:CoA:oxalate CoA-transferase